MSNELEFRAWDGKEMHYYIVPFIWEAARDGSIDWDNCYVIGNIYENPELLERGKKDN